jgi:hypothetical protein
MPSGSGIEHREGESGIFSARLFWRRDCGPRKNAAIGANKSIEKKNFEKAIRGYLGVQ